MAKLFEKCNIGSMELRNRIVMAPMGTNLGGDDGYATERLSDYYEERARGGVGLIIIEATCVDGTLGRSFIRQMNIDDDKYIPKLSRVFQAIHKHGAKAAVQLHHGGREISGGAKTKESKAFQPVAPSPIPILGGKIPKELTISEIKGIVSRFATAANRAKKAGADAVEIHGASAYLLAQFLSSASNQRQDEYGGSLENRARILLEIIRAVKESAGEDFPVWCRLNRSEFGIENGFTIEDSKQVARMAQDAGAQAIHPSGWGYGAHFLEGVEPDIPDNLQRLTEEIKKVVSIPVMAVGTIDPQLGEKLLRENRADFISMGRALIADPELPNKVAEGRLDDVRPCIACLKCNLTIARDEYLHCSVNAAAGREQEFRLKAAGRKKKVFVIGGGPGGMEAARIAALRGHQVALYEKDNTLGGQLNIAILPPDKKRIQNLTNYLITQVKKSGVDIKLGKEVDLALVKKAKPDAVILATGATPLVPEMFRVETGKVVNAQDVLLEKVKVGKKVIIVGGELVACETAHFLVNKGKTVSIMRRGPRVAVKMVPWIRQRLLKTLTQKGVVILTDVKYEALTDKGLTITIKEGKRQTVEADTVVLAAGAEPSNELFKELEGEIPEVYQIGDCSEPRSILEAIADGSRIGRTV